MMSGEEFDALYLRHAPELWRFAARRLSSGDVAHDIVQDVFTHVWEHRQNLKIRESIRAYLFTLVRRRIVDHIRRDKTVSAAEELTYQDDVPGMGAPIPDAGVVLSESELTEAFVRVLEQAPPQHRELLTLRWYHDLSYAEIAEVLGISISAAQKQVSRSMAVLKPLLEKLL